VFVTTESDMVTRWLSVKMRVKRRIRVNSFGCAAYDRWISSRSGVPPVVLVCGSAANARAPAAPFLLLPRSFPGWDSLPGLLPCLLAALRSG